MSKIKYGHIDDSLVVGERWTDHFAHVGTVLGFNEFGVLWADRTTPVNPGEYTIDYYNPSVISIDAFRKKARYSEVMAPGPKDVNQYIKEPENLTILMNRLPKNVEQYKALLAKERRSDRNFYHERNKWYQWIDKLTQLENPSSPYPPVDKRVIVQFKPDEAVIECLGFDSIILEGKFIHVNCDLVFKPSEGLDAFTIELDKIYAYMIID